MSIEEVIDILQGIKDGTACLMKDMPRRGEIAIDMAINALSEQQWIPVTKRLPEPRIDVWCNSDLGQMVGYYDETIETWFGRDYLELLVNAWMPLPEPYREGEENV